ncbi:DUF551 domain-containing protein [Escherichia coli]|nr:DUF551 domain-containing protein [Escherichia coli]
MPDTKTAVLVAVEFDRKGDWRMKWATYIPGHPDANDGWIIPGASWKPSHWMPLPEPPKEVFITIWEFPYRVKTVCGKRRVK